MEAAFEKAVIPTGEVEYRHTHLISLAPHVELMPVTVFFRMIKIIPQIRNGILKPLDPVVDRQMAEMLFFEPIPEVHLRLIWIIIADGLQQMARACALELVGGHHQAIWEQPAEIEH